MTDILEGCHVIFLFLKGSDLSSISCQLYFQTKLNASILDMQH